MDSEEYWKTFSVYDERFWERFIADRKANILGAAMFSRGSKTLETSGRQLMDKLRQELSLSPEEIIAAHTIEHAGLSNDLARDPGTSSGLAGWLASWTQLVQEVEGRYYYEAPEYEFDLVVRDFLETVMDSVSSLREKLTPIAGPWDERFRSATRPAVAGEVEARGTDWWWSRYPKIPMTP